VDRFTADDMAALTDAVVRAWRAGAGGDWSQPAGSLEWSCTKTADHAIDCVLAPAFFLASRRENRYPDGGWTLGDDPTPDVLIDALPMASRVLTGVVMATDPATRAILWQWPEPHLAPPADFLPRAALELALHGFDVCRGLDVVFAPPTDAIDHLRRHTAGWPFWTMSGLGWSPLTLDGDPWDDILRASGRDPR
jgi:hypothetical protein